MRRPCLLDCYESDCDCTGARSSGSKVLAWWAGSPAYCMPTTQLILPFLLLVVAHPALCCPRWMVRYWRFLNYGVTPGEDRRREQRCLVSKGNAAATAGVVAWCIGAEARWMGCESRSKVAEDVDAVVCQIVATRSDRHLRLLMEVRRTDRTCLSLAPCCCCSQWRRQARRRKAVTTGSCRSRGGGRGGGGMRAWDMRRSNRANRSPLLQIDLSQCPEDGRPEPPKNCAATNWNTYSS
nr:hypothetical protein CFP56_63987 [Quercus suber]